MNRNVHVIYREAVTMQADTPHWTTYSYPDSIYAAGPSLEQVRTEFLDAARFHFDDEELSGVSLFEHVETLLVAGVYVRVAVDRRTLDRDAAVAAVRRSFTTAHQLEGFTKIALVAASGDIVIVACTPADRLGWLFEQMGPHDALQICVAGPGCPVRGPAHLDPELDLDLAGCGILGLLQHRPRALHRWGHRILDSPTISSEPADRKPSPGSISNRTTVSSSSA